MNSRTQQKRSLKTRITLLTLVIFVVSIWGLAFYASRVQQSDMERQLGEQQRSIVSFVADEINDELKERVNVLELVANSITPAMLKNPSVVQKFLDMELVVHPHFNGGVFVLSHNGIAIADSPLFNGRVGVDFMDRKYAIGALRKGKATVGDPVQGKALKSQVFTIAVPIRDARGIIIGSLAGTTDLAKPNFLNSLTEHHYGLTGGYLLVAPQARLVVTATDKNRIMRPLPTPGANPAIDRFIGGYEGSDVLVDPNGVEVLVSAKGIPVAGWYAVVSLPTSEAFAPIRNMQFRLLIATLLLSLLASALAWWMLKLQFSPMLAASKALVALSDSNQSHQPLPIVTRDEIGDLIGGFNHLLESLRQQKVALQEEEARYHTLVEWTPEAIVVHRGGKVIYVNPASIRLFGADSAQDLIGRPFLELIHPDYHQIVLNRIKKNVMDGLPAPMIEEKFLKLDGTVIDVEIQGTVIGYDGEPAIYAALRDITERKRAEESLRITAGVFDISQEAILITDADNTIIDVNLAFSRITGYSREEAIGKNPRILNSGQQNKAFYDAMWKSIKTQKSWRGEIWNRRKSGEIYPEMLSISALCDIDGKVIRHIAVFSDISVIKTHEAELSRVAYFDALTGIPNRLLSADRMGHAIYQAAREKNTMAVCYLDLDGFKPINDSMGHAVGDQVLIEVARRIETTIRGGDTVARLGGDEFLFRGDIAYLRGKSSQEPLLYVRVKMSFKLTPVGVLASDDDLAECAPFDPLLQQFGHPFEMMQDLVIHASFGVAGVVARIPIAPSASRQGLDERLLFLDLVEVQMEEAGPLAIYQGHPQMRLRAQHRHEFLQMEAAVDEQLSLGQMRRKIDLAPDVPGAAGKNRLGSRPIGSQLSRQLENALQVGPRALVPAALLGLAQRLTNQVLGQNGLLAMRFIVGRRRLKIKSDGTIGIVTLKLRQLPKIFAGHHLTLPIGTMRATRVNRSQCFGASCFATDCQSEATAASVPGRQGLKL